MEPDLFPSAEVTPEATRQSPAGAPPRGRGTGANPSSRFAEWSRTASDDGWHENRPEAPATQVFVDSAKTVISHNDAPDLPFDQSLNPYRGCEHGCIYCYARPSHAYLGHSPGLDFETLIYHKPDAARLLKKELTRPGYRCRPLALGTNTDAWQPVERRLQLTREVIKVLHALKHPLMLITKSTLVERDIDLLSAMAREQLVHAAISLTTLDGELARRLEPRAAAPHARLETIRRLAAAGIPVSVMVSPVIPGLTDHELEKVLIAAREAGAVGASYSVLRLPHELRALFEHWLAWHAPEKAARVMAILYDLRGGGRMEKGGIEQRMHGLGHFADLLAQRFALHQRRLNYPGMPPLDCSRFAAPAGKPDNGAQLGLF